MPCNALTLLRAAPATAAAAAACSTVLPAGNVVAVTLRRCVQPTSMMQRWLEYPPWLVPCLWQRGCERCQGVTVRAEGQGSWVTEVLHMCMPGFEVSGCPSWSVQHLTFFAWSLRRLRGDSYSMY